MKLYHCADARSLRPLWALEELGAEYELVNMAFPPRATYPGYLNINPLGTVPTFVDGDITLTESTGICHYLGEKFAPTDLRVDPSEPAYGEYLNWMYRSDATLTFPQTIVLRYTRLEPKERRLPQAAEDYTVWYLSRLRSVEAALEDQEFLCAGRFTMADIAVHYALFLGETLGLAERYKPRSRDYLERLKARPAFRRAREKQAVRAD
ncbi:glutathione S-transferase family protein [Phenylobacterium sp.]|jgi:glutathione S-transferase|uniref:glutathione S-transferase family protein n=1 Tax=Phenylobacterium sp. TaxID=1871053 RepID=UPI0025DEEEE3|nr:glutathione S-transferase family protein [Phenylobacterium sp.]MCA6286733.1 glutathione S-transferase family protein [Phenylobacterium sp.]MCA6287686.1 glutathione S-transferase family protein [Phenylobacterium sp.]MCA6310792.1 glutathione S-transferase family protein [Phenylobacterium sp.]MCA6324313.1 glutathione S-transferase family protein [Phenylobacterium sp.]MCA6337770.1 glutathione S-transferase family protein [Phenylobacterium sp.]